MCKGSYAELEQQLKEEEEKKNGNEALSRRHMLLHDRLSTLTAFSVPHVSFKAVAFVAQEHAGPLGIRETTIQPRIKKRPEPPYAADTDF